MPAILLLLAHIAGDFYLQTRRMAEKKAQSAGTLLLHSGIYGLCILLVALCFGTPGRAALAAGIAFAAHFVIDCAKLALNRKYPERQLLWFALDQALHAAVLLALSAWLPGTSRIGAAVGAALSGAVAAVLPGTAGHERRMALAVLLYLALWTPAGVVVRLTLDAFGKQESTAGEVARVGELIGKLERAVAFTLCLLGAPASIAFVLTAKSIARFKQLEEKGFAERYLIGTLLSVSLALLCYAAYQKAV